MILAPQRKNASLSPAELPTLWPDPVRTRAMDEGLRVRLRESIDHIADAADGLDFDDIALLRAVRVGTRDVTSPWVFALYSRLVRGLSGKRGALSDLIRDLAAAAAPARRSLTAYRDPTIPATWWDHLDILMDTDKDHPFLLAVPSADAVEQTKAQLAGGFDLLRLSPALYEELDMLLGTIVLAVPDGSDFNGGSSFFFWRGVVLNAARQRSPVAVADLLVHEGSHLLLFGLSADRPLTSNAGGERYSSPFRPDPRPVDGIFHACFVATRVHLAMSQILTSPNLGAADRQDAIARRAANSAAARKALDVLAKHAIVTENGRAMLDEMSRYWLLAETDG
jgi:HEXXH motif-containing protein